MPWCEPCGRYLAPNTVEADGSCPTCGNEVDPGPDPSPSDAAAAGKIPWHFWVILVLVALYLGWRAVQGIALLF